MKIETKRTFMLSQKEFDMMNEAINWYNEHAAQLNELYMGDLDLYEIFDRILNHCEIDETGDCYKTKAALRNDSFSKNENDGDYDDDDYDDDDYYDDWDDDDDDPFDDDDDYDDDCGDDDESDTERIKRIVKATDDWDEIFNEIINGD